jgi:hypothetical protein
MVFHRKWRMLTYVKNRTAGDLTQISGYNRATGSSVWNKAGSNKPAEVSFLILQMGLQERLHHPSTLQVQPWTKGSGNHDHDYF